MDQYKQALANIGMYMLEHALLQSCVISYILGTRNEEEFLQTAGQSPLIDKNTLLDTLEIFKRIRANETKTREAASMTLQKIIIFRDMIRSYPLILEALDELSKKNLSAELEQLIELIGNSINPSGNWKK